MNPLFWLTKKTKYDEFAAEFSETRNRPWPEFPFFWEEVKTYLSKQERNLFQYKQLCGMPPFFTEEKNNKKSIKAVKILDIGCGNGRLVHFLEKENLNSQSSVFNSKNQKEQNKQEKNIKFQYIGLDSSQKLLEKARQVHPEKKFVLADMRKISFPHNTFDILFSIASLHHLPTKKARIRSLQEMYRVLKPGGKLLLTVWNLNQNNLKFKIQNLENTKNVGAIGNCPNEKEKCTKNIRSRFAKKLEQSKKIAKIRSLLLPWWSKNDLMISFGKQEKKRLYYAYSIKELKEELQLSGFELEEIFGVETPYTGVSENNSQPKKTKPELGKNLCIIAKKPFRENILGVPFDAITFDQALEKLHKYSASNYYEDRKAHSHQLKFITTPNPEICIAAQKDKEYKKILQAADISVPDGWGILWAADFFHSRKKCWFASVINFFLNRKSKYFPERVAGSDLFRKFCETSKEKIFLLGGAEGVAEKVKKYFNNKKPEEKNDPDQRDLAGFTNEINVKHQAKIVGTDSGKFTPDDEERIIKKINESGASVLFVAFGAPAQEKWIHRNKERLQNIRLAMGVGGSFDFIAGTQKRAPRIFRNFGVEWLWRLIREPKRWSRILTATIKFPREVVKSKKS